MRDRLCAALRRPLPRRQQAERMALAAARAIFSRRFTVNTLFALIVAELVTLGVGVAGKLEHAANVALEAAQAEWAAIEAQSFANARPKGSASLGTEPADAPTVAANGSTANGSIDHNAPPPLPPRDVLSIVADETGEWLDDSAWAVPADSANNEPAPSAESGINAAADSAPQPDAELQAELDRLIRKGVSALTASDMRLCVLSFEQARAISPNHPALLYYYGMAYDKLLNPAKAREYYTKVFQMRDKAGKYFERASRRLTFGFEQPSAMRGKLAFGPCLVRRSGDETQGETVRVLLPVLLAPGEEISKLDDIYITLQFFDLVNGRKIEFSRRAPSLAWQNEKPTWEDNEEALVVTHSMPPLTQEEADAYGDLQYYGFTAKLYYQGEPLDCISMPSALILQEQRLNSRRLRQSAPASGLLPDDGLAPDAEEATPFSEFLETIDPSE